MVEFRSESRGTILRLSHSGIALFTVKGDRRSSGTVAVTCMWGSELSSDTHNPPIVP